MKEMTFAERLINSAKQAEAHSSGRKRLNSNSIEILPIQRYEPCQIKDIRIKLGLTQSLMGGIVGVSPKTVEAWEAGNRRPGLSASRIIAELDTNPDYFDKIVKTR